MIKRILAYLVSYCFVYITAIQLFTNLVFVFNKQFYIEHAFLFTNIAGLSVTYLIPLVAIVFVLKYCNVSRICAIAQVILTVLWLIIQEDNVYNIIAQIIISTLALAFTYVKFKTKLSNKLTDFITKIIKSFQS